MPILHYGTEIWGHENAAQLESVQLGYFKRLYGLHKMTHTQFLKGDLGLWSLKSYRTVQMTKFWLRVVQLPSDRLLKASNPCHQNPLSREWKKLYFWKTQRYPYFLPFTLLVVTELAWSVSRARTLLQSRVNDPVRVFTILRGYHFLPRNMFQVKN
jgi:hypothetical protein